MTALAVQVFDAAALRAANPRYAHMIPTWAKTVKMLAGIVLGVGGTRPRPRALSAKQFNFRARRAHEVDDLIRLRLQRGPLSRKAQAEFAVAIASVSDVDRAVAWIRLFCPALDADELEQIITDAVFEPRRWTATQFGDLLGLTKDERQRLGIRTFRWVGATKRSMKADRKGKDAAYQRAKRALNAKPKRPSLRQLKPWLVMGISERTFWRWKKDGKIVVGADGSIRVGNTCITLLPTKVLPHHVRDAAAPEGAAPMPSTNAGASGTRQAKRGGSRKAKCPASMKADASHAGHAAPLRGRASGGDWVTGRFFPPALTDAERGAPIFGDVPATEIRISFRRRCAAISTRLAELNAFRRGADAITA